MAPPDKQQTTRPLLDEVLLDAKLSLPDLSGPGIVGRGVLVEAARASGQRFVSITAPAGYGKTTLLSQWLDVEDRMTAYVSLNRFDDDPNLLLALLASAYERMYPNSGATAEVSGLGVSALGRATPRLAGILGSTESPFVLIIDDLHELQSDDCQDVLGVLMSGVPDHSQLVTSSRTSQPNIPRLRASGQVMEIGIAELALDSTGAHEIFAAQRVTITPKQASLLAERTEGWPVGLYLASLIAIESDGDPLAVTGDDRYLADYLYDELIHRLPNDVRQFLYRTSVLDELSAPLCDALLETTGSQQMLRYLESNRMFLFPLDRRSEWYRYHDLFREFLLGEVRRYEPESVEQLHLLAANWYEAEGATTKAVEHLLETADKTRCAFMIAEASLRTYQSGHMPTIARWFKRLGDVGVELYPPLASLAGQLAALQGLTAEAEHWLAVVEHNSYDETPIDGTASFESGRAIFRSIVCPNGPEEMLADAQFALAQEPPESLWRDGALDTCAQAYLMLGDRERARALFEETAEVAEKTSGTDNFVIAEAELAIMDIEEGRPAEASRHA